MTRQEFVRRVTKAANRVEASVGEAHGPAVALAVEIGSCLGTGLLIWGKATDDAEVKAKLLEILEAVEARAESLGASSE